MRGVAVHEHFVFFFSLFVWILLQIFGESALGDLYCALDPLVPVRLPSRRTFLQLQGNCHDYLSGAGLDHC